MAVLSQKMQDAIAVAPMFVTILEEQLDMAIPCESRYHKGDSPGVWIAKWSCPQCGFGQCKPTCQPCVDYVMTMYAEAYSFTCYSIKDGGCNRASPKEEFNMTFLPL